MSNSCKLSFIDISLYLGTKFVRLNGPFRMIIGLVIGGCFNCITRMQLFNADPDSKI